MPETGGEGDDTFYGSNSVAGSFYGNGGNDWLRSGLAADVFDGGQGRDTVDYSRENAGVSVNLASGVGARGDQLVSVEDVVGSSFNDTIAGTSGDNRLDGGAGVDTVSYAAASAAVTVSLLLEGLAQNTGGAGVDTLTRLQNLTGSAYADNLTGNKSDNVLLGGGGNDHLYGDAGNDSLVGGDGYDWLYGGGGANTLAGGLGDDTYVLEGPDMIQEFAGAGFDTVNVSWAQSARFAYTLSANLEILNFHGAAGADILGNAMEVQDLQVRRQGVGEPR